MSSLQKKLSFHIKHEIIINQTQVSVEYACPGAIHK